MPVVLVFIIYSLIYFIFNGNRFFNIGLILTSLFFYLVRALDDILDYEKDLSNNKVLFSKKLLKILGCILGLLFICFSIVFGYYYFLILLILIFISYYFKYIKIIFIPSVIFLIIFYEMQFSYIFFIISLVFIIVDFILVRKE